MKWNVWNNGTALRSAEGHGHWVHRQGFETQQEAEASVERCNKAQRHIPEPLKCNYEARRSYQ